MMNENIYTIIEESAKKSTGNIEACSVHIYSHLMKIVTHDIAHKDWIQTIYEQCRQLKKITNPTYWRCITNDKSKLNDIKLKAMDEYLKDYNTEPEAAFEAVCKGHTGRNDGFSSIEKFKDWNKLKDFIIYDAILSGDDNIIDYIENYKK